ncbi:MAG: glycosyltransferase family 2 protein [Anaerolineales bacterium]|nr:glycosyltransferase family 2 protein [Anaerolineales bacterium]
MITYHLSPSIQLDDTGVTPTAITPQGGRIMLDRALISLLRRADGLTVEDILLAPGAWSAEPNAELASAQVRAALACLAEAGLLSRSENISPPDPAPKTGPARVSVVIVSYNSQEWLTGCLSSLLAQTHQPLEIILVDNASSDGSADEAERSFPGIRIIRLKAARSLAGALNVGIQAASGEYTLLLNPDVVVEKDAVGQLVAAAQRQAGYAAVAAKLKFLWAPEFLNGLGNYVGAFSWGADIGLGHLDLGQFDRQGQLPSACFAAALIPAAAWQAVGPIDEGFPMYYEDSEWCCRARLLGHSICAAPQAIVYHAFGGQTPGGAENALAPRKLHRVTYGRLRFITKILAPAYFIRFLAGYLLEDALRFALHLLRLRLPACKACLAAWRDYLKDLPALRTERENLQKQRKMTDKDLLQEQRKAPVALMRNGLPLLTWDILCTQYLPLILAGQTRPLPEFDQPTRALPVRNNLFTRLRRIWRYEGFSALLHRAGKYIQWKLAQP